MNDMMTLLLFIAGFGAALAALVAIMRDDLAARRSHWRR